MKWFFNNDISTFSHRGHLNVVTWTWSPERGHLNVVTWTWSPERGHLNVVTCTWSWSKENERVGTHATMVSVLNAFLTLSSCNMIFVCVGVMFSGEYDVCDVTLSIYLHRTSLKNMPGHGGNRTYDLWKVVFWLVFQRSYVRFPPWPGIFFKLVRCGYILRVTPQTSYSPEYTHQHRKNHITIKIIIIIYYYLNLFKNGSPSAQRNWFSRGRLNTTLKTYYTH
jgi:hypothetical protein